jgi:hypothetical protein
MIIWMSQCCLLLYVDWPSRLSSPHLLPNAVTRYLDRQLLPSRSVFQHQMNAPSLRSQPQPTLLQFCYTPLILPLQRFSLEFRLCCFFGVGADRFQPSPRLTNSHASSDASQVATVRSNWMRRPDISSFHIMEMRLSSPQRNPEARWSFPQVPVCVHKLQYCITVRLATHLKLRLKTTYNS